MLRQAVDLHVVFSALDRSALDPHELVARFVAMRDVASAAEYAALTRDEPGPAPVPRQLFFRGRSARV